mmetsp:Transcript_34920/g.104159  ORF Transcript_34920/g.104159 Transcript_34920/m.104159 type:complete len:262 (+) Transcript_34920:466-1251(+)
MTECIQKLCCAKVCPLSLDHHLIVDAKGNTIPKKQVTHNLSFPVKESAPSINESQRRNSSPACVGTFDKGELWIGQIKVLLHGDVLSSKNLKSPIRKLNHAGHTMPTSRHFVSRLRKILARVQGGKDKILPAEHTNLHLWMSILNASVQGTSINNILFRCPTIIFWTDASKHGIGGCNNRGLAWHRRIPNWMLGSFTLNCLNFIASEITIELSLVDNSLRGMRPLSLRQLVHGQMAVQVISQRRHARHARAHSLPSCSSRL